MMKSIDYTETWTAAAAKAFKAVMAVANEGMINGGSSKPRNKNPFLHSTDQESNLRYWAKLEETSQKP